jgi:hypothetical protein
MTEMKLQTPSSNIQRSTKFQASNNYSRHRRLEVGAWSFSGAWMLALGALLTLTFTSCAIRRSQAQYGFQIEPQSDRLIITHDSKPVAHFVFADTNILRPYFAHVHTPDGIQVTRNHPPIAGVDPVDHPTMHPGIWLAFGNISNQDFWRNKATIRHERFTSQPEISKDRLTFATASSLIATNTEIIGRIDSSFAIQTVSGGYLVAWQATFSPRIGPLSFGDQEEMGFGIRIATPLSEKNGGTVKNSDGLVGAKHTWGKTAIWCDYSGILSNRLVGITVMAHPKNFRPSWMHSRDYGLIVANPFGQKSFTKREASSVAVNRGEPFTLRFAALIHSSPTNEPPDLNTVLETSMSK